MSPPSLSTKTARRVPVQDRSEKRVASLLAHAEAVLAKVGYEATTMTEIAARAKTSIGSVYQYFPNKEAITSALYATYGAACVELWSNFQVETQGIGTEELGSAIIDKFFAFANDMPAFFPIMNAPVMIKKDPAVRERLRAQFSDLFKSRDPGLSDDDAMQVATVTLLTIRGLIMLCAELRAKDRPSVVAEYQVLLAAYLKKRISPPAGS
ncbi:MAG TPA: TetR/AcrR family transcriptional regulator [Opitutaceae bacterium]|jgi:AcrR family transcriptional regulator|nr:TetR/AcrR family transcriptional regulator [Opitutaceae bacterium]